MTGHVVESDTVSVEIIENRQADLVTLSVVWLGELQSSSVGPGHVVVSPARRPADPAVPDLTSSPEISLPVLGHETQEVVLLVPAVQADRPHVVGLAEPLRLALGELGATESPADEEALSFVTVIRRCTPATLASLGSSPVGVVVVPGVVVSVVVPVVAASWLLLSASPQLTSVVPVVPVGPSLGLADQDQEEGEQEESEEESHDEISQVSG